MRLGGSITRILRKTPASNTVPLSHFRKASNTTPTMAAAASVAKPNALTVPINKTAHEFDKTSLDAMLSRRFFYAPAFEIYGGMSTSVCVPVTC